MIRAPAARADGELLWCLQRIKAEIVMWTAGFVLLTLIVNAPLLPWVLRVTGLSKGVILCPCSSSAPDMHSASDTAVFHEGFRCCPGFFGSPVFQGCDLLPLPILSPCYALSFSVCSIP